MTNCEPVFFSIQQLSSSHKSLCNEEISLSPLSYPHKKEGAEAPFPNLKIKALETELVTNTQIEDPRIEAVVTTVGFEEEVIRIRGNFPIED